MNVGVVNRSTLLLLRRWSDDEKHHNFFVVELRDDELGECALLNDASREKAKRDAHHVSVSTCVPGQPYIMRFPRPFLPSFLSHFSTNLVIIYFRSGSRPFRFRRHLTDPSLLRATMLSFFPSR